MPQSWRSPGGVLSTTYTLPDVEDAAVTLTYVSLGDSAASVVMTSEYV